MTDIIEIELPFAGFYESIPDSQIDDAIEQCFTYDYDTGDEIELSEAASDAIYMADVDWQAIRVEYSERYTELLGNELDIELTYTGLQSPKYYNFSTDRIFATVPATQINAIRAAVQALPDYADNIRERFTSYDGFSSNYDNNISHDDWTRPTLDACQYAVILELYLDGVCDTPRTDTLCNIYGEMTVNEFSSIDTAVTLIQQYMTDKVTK